MVTIQKYQHERKSMMILLLQVTILDMDIQIHYTSCTCIEEEYWSPSSSSAFITMFVIVVIVVVVVVIVQYMLNAHKVINKREREAPSTSKEKHAHTHLYTIILHQFVLLQALTSHLSRPRTSCVLNCLPSDIWFTSSSYCELTFCYVFCFFGKTEQKCCWSYLPHSLTHSQHVYLWYNTN